MKHDWEYKKLGEVVQYFTGNRPSGGVCQIKEGALSLGGEHIGKDGYIDLSTAKYVPQDFYTVNTKGHIFDGDVLMCKDGALTGKVALVRNELNGLCSMVNEHVFILRSVSMTHPYLFYFLFSNNGQTQIKNRISGAAQGGLNSTNLKSIQIPVPPLSTQQSIVSELDSLSKIIADCKETLKDYDALEQSIFYDMFGDPVKNEKGWEVKKWSDVFDTKLGKMLDKAKQLETDQQYPYLANFNVQWRTFDLTDLRTMAFSENELTKYSLQEGDLMICEGGESGRCAVWHDLGQTILFQKAIHRARLKCSLDANVEYVSFLMQILKLGNGLKDFISQSTIEHLTGEKLNKLPIPLPPLPLQQQFASKIEAIEEMKVETKKALQEAETLFQARMDYWFN